MYLKCDPITSDQYLPVTRDGTSPFAARLPSIASSLNRIFATRAYYMRTAFTTARFVPRIVLVPSFDHRVLNASCCGGAPRSACSQVTIDGGRVSNLKIMAVRRGFMFEGDLLDFLEKAVLLEANDPM